MSSPSTDTPMMRQYRDIKAQHGDAIVFFRLGDFYEMFEGDAVIASKELELTLTSRGGRSPETRMPMCGVPYHASENYIHKLIRRGFKVAICEQVENPATAIGLTRRKVVRVVTPGTVDNPEQLSKACHNFLMALAWNGTDAAQSQTIAVVYADVSTGEAYATQLPGLSALADELERVRPVEILVPTAIEKLFPCVHTIYPVQLSSALRPVLAAMQNHSRGLLDYIRNEPGQTALAMLIDYSQAAAKLQGISIRSIDCYQAQQYMHLDLATRRNLELTEQIFSERKSLSLYDVLNHTRTAMGARLLKQTLHWPLRHADRISRRHDAVAELAADLVLREELKSFLKQIYDIRRLSSRLSTLAAGPRDLQALAKSLQLLPLILEALRPAQARMLATAREILQASSALADLAGDIVRTLVTDPPLVVSEGGLIAPGVSAELDELRSAAAEVKTWMAGFEAEEKEKTGIKSLKIGFNHVFGYYIEVTKSNLAQVPAEYIRKQTLSTGERYITEALKERETYLLKASEQMQRLELEIFTQLRGRAAAEVDRLYQVSEQLAWLDVLLSLAATAVELQWVRPSINSGDRLSIEGGRHPAVEPSVPKGSFVPNDTRFSRSACRFMLLTGPNMSGKSTYLRQVGLIVLLAQMGSFVPAKSASLPLVDRIFTRVGAQDDLAGGRSTFMVEMSEAANIVNHATGRSLLLIDEVGRGTSTFDGLAIAAALAEHLHDQIQAFTIFSTHYHELTQLPDQKSGMQNFNVAVTDEGDHVVFLHKVVPGAAPGSYGIHVAKMAGLPDSIIARASELLERLESSSEKRSGKAKPLQLF